MRPTSAQPNQTIGEQLQLPKTPGDITERLKDTRLRIIGDAIQRISEVTGLGRAQHEHPDKVGQIQDAQRLLQGAVSMTVPKPEVTLIPHVVPNGVSNISPQNDAGQRYFHPGIEAQQIVWSNTGAPDGFSLDAARARVNNAYGAGGNK